MSLARPSTAERVQVALAGVLACGLVLVPLTGSGPAASELAAVSLVVLALAGALTAAPRAVVPPLGPVLHLPVAGAAGPPVLRTRQTDPTHHPLAPRAPGQD